MTEDPLDTVPRNMPSLIPLSQEKIIRRNPGSTGMQIAGDRVLGILVRNGSLPISEVGRRLRISNSYMTKLADGLIREEHAERLPDDKDRRGIKLKITGKGRRRLKKGKTQFKETIRESLSELGEEDLQILNESMENLTRIRFERKIPRP